MDAMQLNWLGAFEGAQAVRDGLITAQDLAQACLARIEAEEPRVQAWAHLDPAHALGQARALDEARAEGRPQGPLAGVPVGVKDIIDTGDMPTEDGTVLHAGRMPMCDAPVVAALRAAGALILGKTVTTELATYTPGKTRNPHNLEHTPGGSSSGSAAAVAAGMVPVALGTQTNGSLIRPASYCGVFAYKPTFGLVPRRGVLRQSRPLDQVGVFARSVRDLALVGEQIIGWDEHDEATRPRARPPLLATATAEPPLPPTLAFARTPLWNRADADCRAGFEELAAFLGERVKDLTLPDSTLDALDWHRSIMEADIAASYEWEWESGRERLSPALRAQIERGRAVPAVDYLRALARIPILNAGFEEVFDRHDAILTLATGGAAPAGLDSTGDPSYCTLWTLCGMPTVSLPLLQGENGLPIGVQLVGRRGDDARLLRTAQWLVDMVTAG